MLTAARFAVIYFQAIGFARFAPGAHCRAVRIIARMRPARGPF